MRLIFSAEFEANFEVFYNYLYSDNPNYAVKWRVDFLESLTKLKLFPKIGSLSDKIGKRKLFISPLWIFYTFIDEKTIFLNICYHTSQNFTK